MKTEDILKMLAAHYSPPNFAFLPEFRAATGYGRESRADGIAMSLWKSAKEGMEIIGFEVKASRSDWLRELKLIGKAEPVKQFCDRWYLVCTHASIVKDFDEIPHDWGFIFPKDGKLDYYKPAPKLEAQPLDRQFIGALMRRATRVDALPHVVPPNNDWGKK